MSRMMAERISAGLARKSVTTCSRWAEQYRILGAPLPGPWSFRRHPWLKDMHNSDAELNIGMKASQVGFTECMLNRVFFQLDIRKTDVLYVLPSTTPDSSDFSAGRLTPAMDLSPHIKSMFTDCNNVGFKRAGTSSLYVRGSRSRSQLKSIPVGLVILDEMDEMDQSNVPMAMERMSGQEHKSAWMISTPTLPGCGIHARYEVSTQNSFFFHCPSCSRLIDLTYPESLIITADRLDDPRLQETRLICKDCKATLPHETKADWLEKSCWVPAFPGRDSEGWSVSHLYSTTVSPVEIARGYIIGQTDKAVLMEWNNQKLGRPFLIEGARLTEDELNNCIAGYKNGELGHNGIVTMGIDVGPSINHYCIVGWDMPQYASGSDINLFAQGRLLKFGKVKNFEDLDTLMNQFGAHYAVIDAQPEKRKSLEFANRFYGRVKLNFYSGTGGRVLTVSESEQTVTSDRTTWLDLTLGRIKRGKPYILFPSDIDAEFRAHLKALLRDYRDDQHGRKIGRYVKPDREHDHFAHAMNYAEIALPLAASLGRSTDLIKNVV